MINLIPMELLNLNALVKRLKKEDLSFIFKVRFESVFDEARTRDLLVGNKTLYHPKPNLIQLSIYLIIL